MQHTKIHLTPKKGVFILKLQNIIQEKKDRELFDKAIYKES